MSPAGRFPTFCHISEYGAAGYQALHRMLAMSEPLNLWAPSSALLRDPSTRISPDDFLRYVEAGMIRILGRREWLVDRRFRERHPWEGARWDRQLDGTLRSFYREDESKPAAERRVMELPAEAGWEWAEQYLDANPDEVERWRRVLNSKDVEAKIPAGTLQAIARGSDHPRDMARAVLRDAYNHGEAFVQARSVAPFLLSPADRRFLNILAEAPSSQPGPPVPAPAQRRKPFDASLEELTAQMLEVLRHLDVHSQRRARRGSLDEFLRGEGRDLLVRWFSRVCSILTDTGAKVVDDKVISVLRSDLRGSRFDGPLRDLARRPDESAVATAGLICGVIELAANPAVPLMLTSLALAVYPVGKGLCRQLGWVPATYSGPQWPFLYAYDSAATKRLHTRLSYALSEFRTAP